HFVVSTRQSCAKAKTASRNTSQTSASLSIKPLRPTLRVHPLPNLKKKKKESSCQVCWRTLSSSIATLQRRRQKKSSAQRSCGRSSAPRQCTKLSKNLCQISDTRFQRWTGSAATIHAISGLGQHFPKLDSSVGWRPDCTLSSRPFAFDPSGV